MTTPNQSSERQSARLVQIEPLRQNQAATNSSEFYIDVPKLTDSQVFWKKTYILYRKLIGFFYTDHSYGAFRRWYLSKILPDKVLYRWMPYRKGECNRCGLCCKIIFDCSFFVKNEQGTACSIYTDPKHAPSACVVFPIDPKDIQEVHKQIAPAPCPFHFEGEPEHPSTWGALKAYWREEMGRRVDKLKEDFNF
jgi:hypothetical protein